MVYLIACLVFAGAFITGLDATARSQQSFQFEQLPNKTAPGYNIWRSEASKALIRHIVSVNNDTVIVLPICITPEDESLPVLFTLHSLFYSNDGYEDFIDIFMDGEFIGSVTTIKMLSKGDEWNVIQNSNIIGREFEISPGRHEMMMTFKTSHHGVDLDKLRVNLINQDIDKQVFCLDDVPTE